MKFDDDIERIVKKYTSGDKFVSTAQVSVEVKETLE